MRFPKPSPVAREGKKSGGGLVRRLPPVVRATVQVYRTFEDRKPTCWSLRTLYPDIDSKADLMRILRLEAFRFSLRVAIQKSLEEVKYRCCFTINDKHETVFTGSASPAVQSRRPLIRLD